MINAGIKSREELKERLENGEEFWISGLRVHYSEDEIYKGCSPYKVGINGLLSYWDSFSSMEIKKDPIERWLINQGRGNELYLTKKELKSGHWNCEKAIRMVEADDATDK